LPEPPLAELGDDPDPNEFVELFTARATKVAASLDEGFIL